MEKVGSISLLRHRTSRQIKSLFIGFRAALISSHLEPLGHSVGEADGELLHLGNLQPLLLCLELCASFHYHLEMKKETLKEQI